jgi:biopolymer transport protein ExbD
MNFGEQERRRPELSIASLIDIVFLLLVFFMLAGSFLNLEALDLAAPGAATSSAGGGESDSLVIRLHDDGAVTFGNVVVDPDEIRERVEQAHAEDADLNVVVVAPSQEAVQRLITVVDDIRLAGVDAIAIAVRDEP